MLRWRKPLQDDKRIIQIVKKELIPKANSYAKFHSDEQTATDIPLRLKHGITYVETDHKDQVLGFVHLIFVSRITLIDLLAVDSAAQRHGIGTKLMAQAEYVARTRRCISAILLYDEGNEKARRFYERLGYRVTRHMPDLHCYVMEKRLLQPYY